MRIGLALMTAVSAAAVPLFRGQVQAFPRPIFGYSDFPVYLQVTRDLSLVPFEVPAHFLFHVSTWLASLLLGIEWGAVVVCSLSTGLAAVGAYVLGYRRSGGRDGLPPGGAAALSVWFLLAETPTVLAVAAGWLHIPPRMAVLHTWSSPTDTVCFGVAILALVLVLDLLESSEDPLVPAPRIWAVAALTILAGLAKPSFTVPLVPALVVIVLADRGRRPDSGRILRWVVAPNALVVFAQVVLVTRFIPDRYGDAGIGLVPLETIREMRLGSTGVWFWLAALVVPLCAWIGGRRWWRDTGTRLSLIALGVALVIAVLLTETGPRGGDPNLARPAFFWWVLLVLTSSRVAALEVADRWRARPPDRGLRTWGFVAVPVAAAFLASGVIVYLDAIGVGSLLRWSVG